MQRTFTVAVLGATGTVGQRMISLLTGHPWFKVVALCASERSAGKSYYDACNWTIDTPMPAWAGAMTVADCTPRTDVDIVLSALDANVAGDIELAWAAAGAAVVSNARNHRMEEDVPLVIPEVNPEHLEMIHSQRARRGWSTGCLVTNPNCSTIGLVCALKPLHDAFFVQSVMVTTMQAVSGAGYPGVPSLDILDNVIPYIGGEEEKMQTETLKLLGGYDAWEQEFWPAQTRVSAHCNRVPVIDGHTESVSVQLGRPARLEDVQEAWRAYVPAVRSLGLPTVPELFIAQHAQPGRPQPRRDRNLGRGMTVSVGRLRPCPLFSWRFTVLSHNTVRGAAGAAIANAELLAVKGFVKP